MSSTERPTVVLVHGAFAESASWNRVIAGLHGRGLPAVAVANPLRGLAGDAAYVRDVIEGIGRPVVLVGHSYGGMVITEAAAGLEAVRSLVYVAAFAPDPGESALLLSGKFEGSTLASALVAYPVSTGATRSGSPTTSTTGSSAPMWTPARRPSWRPRSARSPSAR